MISVPDYISNVNQLIPRPDIALDVLTLAHSPECSAPQLATLVEKDPCLTANMLRLANSALFGHMKKIASIRDIIVRLGLEAVSLLAIAGASISLLKTPLDAYNLKSGDLWRHSYATAILAGIIGRRARVADTAAVYTAALLHDVGKAILNQPLILAVISRGEDKNGMGFLERERFYLHTDHAKVGADLLSKWLVPRRITLPVALHHCEDLEVLTSLSARIVFAANWLEGYFDLKNRPAEWQPDERSCSVAKENIPPIPGVTEELEEIIAEFLTEFERGQDIVFL